MKIIGGYPFGLLEPARLETSPDGWDMLIERELVLNQNEGSQGDRRTSPGIAGSFYLQSKSCVGFIGCEAVMEFRSLGLHSSKDFVIEGKGFAERVTGPTSGIPDAPAGVHPAAVVATRVGITVRYFSTSKPDCTLVGTKIDPPDDFGIPTNPFYAINDALYNVPWGWVLDNRVPKQLPGTNLYAVTDDYGYYWLANFNGA